MQWGPNGALQAPVGGFRLVLGDLGHKANLGELHPNSQNQRHRYTEKNTKSSTLNFTPSEVLLGHKDNLKVKFYWTLDPLT